MSQSPTPDVSHDIPTQPIRSLDSLHENMAICQPLSQGPFHDTPAQPIQFLDPPREENTTNGISDFFCFWGDSTLPLNLEDNHLSSCAPDECTAAAATLKEHPRDTALDLCGQGMAAVVEIASSIISEGVHSFTPLPEFDIENFFDFNGQPESDVLDTPALTQFDEDTDLADALGNSHTPAFVQPADGDTPHNAVTGSAVDPHAALGVDTFGRPVRQGGMVADVSDDYCNDSDAFSHEIADPKLKQRDVADEATISPLEISGAPKDPHASPSCGVNDAPTAAIPLESRCTFSLPEEVDLVNNQPPPDHTAQEPGSDICPLPTKPAQAISPVANRFMPPSKPATQAESGNPISSDKKSARPSSSPRHLSIVIPVRSCQSPSPGSQDDYGCHSPADGTDGVSTCVDSVLDDWSGDEWPKEADNPLGPDSIDSSNDNSDPAKSKSATNKDLEEEIIDLTVDTPIIETQYQGRIVIDLTGDIAIGHTQDRGREVIDLTGDITIGYAQDQGRDTLNPTGDHVPNHTDTDISCGNKFRFFLVDDDVFASPSESIVVIDLSGPEHGAAAALLQMKRKTKDTDIGGATMPQWATSKRPRLQEYIR